jgi:hypothetical protein
VIQACCESAGKMPAGPTAKMAVLQTESAFQAKT